MSDVTEPTVIARKQGRIGRITLNRPKALNAVDLPMIRAVADALESWRDDPAVHAVVIEGAGGRAFCAGGDIRQVRSDSIAGNHQAINDFFSNEYRLNLTIARYPKTFIALVDGFCMGGGVGLSVHGAIRVASEAAVFAMPETAIALFPDVGATYALPRLRGDWGMCLGLTGHRVNGPEAVWLGLATHYVPHERMAGLADAIAEAGTGALAAFAEAAPQPALADEDASAFGADGVPAIVTALEADARPFAQKALAAVRQGSPSSVLWSYEILKQGAQRTLEQCLTAELALTGPVTRHPDFLEGVRAMVVDKDKVPKWTPSSLETVDAEQIHGMFTNA